MFYDNSIDIHIGKKLRAARRTIKMSQRELAELSGIAFQQISKYESGINRISASKLYEISQILNYPISSFFHGYQGDDGYYNFNFKEETEYKELQEHIDEELQDLISGFNRINSFSTRRHIINLVNSIGENQKPTFGFVD